MLRHLSIKDFVIVEQIDLDLMPGFTVVTGETGAGKSIVIDAITLALGERGDISQIRMGCDRAEINALFDVSRMPDMINWLRENDLDGDHDSCLLRRIIESSGRSRSYINGHGVTLQQLRHAGIFLIDIHSQHAHLSLLQKDAQRELIDAFSGCTDMARGVKEAYLSWQECQQQRIIMEQRAKESNDKREQLEWQVNELSALNLTIEEWRKLQADHGRLSHVATLMAAADMAVEALSDSESAVLRQIDGIHAELHHLIDYDRQLGAITDLLDSARIQLQEGVRDLKHYRQDLDLDPQALQDIELRLSAIHSVARKYRTSAEELPQLLDHLRHQLDALDSKSTLDQLQAQEIATKAEYLVLAEQLSQARQQGSEALSHQVSAAMQMLAMAGGQFAAVLIPLEQATSHGLEQVEFQVSANQGMPLRPLSKVASGGELSRISLAIQVICSKLDTVPTLIFDEVDVGIGGQVAEIVGNLLKKLAQERQVLCITHLPQVAATGDQQWQVIKSAEPVENQPVTSTIKILDQQERIEEIARMLGGVKITELTRKHAAEMLDHAAFK